jgi:molybdate transport system ATP-binding protein
VSLRADIHLRRGEFCLELAFTAAAGEVVAIVGPNAAGKSTVLEAIAGLIPLERGEIVLDGRVLERVAAGLRLPPQAREVGMSFQGLALFEHLSVLDNVAYGPRARGLSKTEARARAQGWLERFGIAELSERRPGELSGGQAQRVALARALIVEPRILLLDEPFASLDAHVLLEAREVVRETLAGFAGISLIVTHTLADALELADRLLVIEGGELVQEGSPAEVAASPASAHLEAMLGLTGPREATLPRDPAQGQP